MTDNGGFEPPRPPGPSGLPPAPVPPPGYQAVYQPGFQPGYQQQPRTNGLAVASMVCGIVGICTCVLSILAVIFGHVALSQIKKSGGVQKGRGMAIAGLATGYSGLALVVLYGVVLAATNN